MIIEAADSGGRTWNLPKPSWRAVPNNTDLQEPGWTPRTLQNRPHHPFIISLQQQPQHPAPHHRQYPHPPQARHVDEAPAWYGSLRSTTEPKHSDRKVVVCILHVSAFLVLLGTCESEIFVRIESRIESGCSRLRV